MDKDEPLICDKCKKEITENCYVKGAALVTVLCKNCYRTAGLRYAEMSTDGLRN